MGRIKECLSKFLDIITLGKYNTGLFYNKKNGYYNWCTASVSLAILIVVLVGSIIVMADITDYDSWSVNYAKQPSSSVALRVMPLLKQIYRERDEDSSTYLFPDRTFIELVVNINRTLREEDAQQLLNHTRKLCGGFKSSINLVNMEGSSFSSNNLICRPLYNTTSEDNVTSIYYGLHLAQQFFSQDNTYRLKPSSDYLQPAIQIQFICEETYCQYKDSGDFNYSISVFTEDYRYGRWDWEDYDNMHTLQFNPTLGYLNRNLRLSLQPIMMNESLSVNDGKQWTYDVQEIKPKICAVRRHNTTSLTDNAFFIEFVNNEEQADIDVFIWVPKTFYQGFLEIGSFIAWAALFFACLALVNKCFFHRKLNQQTQDRNLDVEIQSVYSFEQFLDLKQRLGALEDEFIEMRQYQAPSVNKKGIN